LAQLAIGVFRPPPTLEREAERVPADKRLIRIGAAAGFLAGLLVSVGLVASGVLHGHERPKSSATPQVARGELTLRVEAALLGDAPFTVSASEPMPPLGRTAPGRWMTHTILYANSTERPILLMGEVGKGFWGRRTKPSLGVDGRGCAFNFGPDVGFGCMGDPVRDQLPPLGSVADQFTLVRGLPGMATLTPGQYTSRGVVRYWVEGGPEQRVGLRITYTVGHA
jgi:hypothetical protein